MVVPECYCKSHRGATQKEALGLGRYSCKSHRGTSQKEALLLAVGVVQVTGKPLDRSL
jgi:hypothetical protein